MIKEVELLKSIIKYYYKLDSVGFKNSLTCVYDRDKLVMGIMVEDFSLIREITNSLYSNENTPELILLLGDLKRMGYGVSIIDGLNNISYLFDVVISDSKSIEICNVTNSNIKNKNYIFDGIYCEITGLSEDSVGRLSKEIFWLNRNISNFRSNSYGSVIFDYEEKGKIYINGILMGRLPNFECGWNLFIDKDKISEEDIYIGIKRVYNSLSKDSKFIIRRCFEVYIASRR